MEENRIYNYFFSFEEFGSYLEEKRFFGRGISSYSNANLGGGDSSKVSLSYNSKKGLLLKFLEGKNDLTRETSDWNDADWVRKEDWFVWTPQSGEEVSIQALDHARLHLYWKSQHEILFSGIIDSNRKSFFQTLLGPIRKLWIRK